MASELLEFPGGLIGVTLNIDEEDLGVVVLGEASHIQEGDPVKQTGTVLSVPVGDALLGRVIDPLGNPVDGKGPINTTERRLLETQAPSVVERQPVKEPLQTGIKAIDSMTPIGRGQRQLIIGDRQIGKTAIAGRHDHQPEGQPGDQGRGQVHLRGHRAEGLHRGRDRGHPRRARRHGVHGRGQCRGLRRTRRCRCMPPTPARPSASTGCTTASTPWSSSTTSPSRPWPIARSRCCCAGLPAVRRTPATCSTCTAGCSSAAPSSPTSSVAARSPGSR